MNKRFEIAVLDPNGWFNNLTTKYKETMRVNALVALSLAGWELRAVVEESGKMFYYFQREIIDQYVGEA